MLHPEQLLLDGAGKPSWASLTPTTSSSIRPHRAMDRSRRGKVVTIFHNSAALLRLVVAVAQAQQDEGQDGKRHLPQASTGQRAADGHDFLPLPLSA